MRDSLNDLFRERFQGHELPVDANVWHGVQSQLGASPDVVNELFKKRFQDHHVTVDPAAWSNISAQLGHTSGTLTTASMAWMAAGVAAVIIATTALLWPTPVTNHTPAEQVAQVREVSIKETSASPAVVSPISESSSSEAPISTKPNGTKSEGATQRPMPQVVPQQVAPTQTTIIPDQTGLDESRLLEGPSVVSSIISNITEEVINEPVTAEPEPGLQTRPADDAKRRTEEPSNMDEPSPELEPMGESPMPKVFMPNTFTPNGDRVNDTYTVEGAGFESIVLRVYSLKNSALVFSTNSGEPWTGDGCEDGMYMVAIEALTSDGRTTTQGKVVWLNRNRLN